MEITQARELLEQEIKAHNFKIVYRKSLSGCVSHKRMVCEIPEGKTRKSIYIVCHELFHVLNKRKSEKVYINEMKAEKFAHNKMRELGISVPRDMTTRAKRYVKHKMIKAINRGLQKINRDVYKYIK